MSTIAQNTELLKQLLALIQAHRAVFKQERSYQRAVGLLLAEICVFARHTVTQLLMSLGLTEQDWSSWYRFFSAGRFRAERAAAQLLQETLQPVAADEGYVVVGDSTQTPRSGGKIEGVGWLRNLRTPPFKVGIHPAQRWFNGSWLMPAEQGYSRALPLRFLPAFTEKSKRQVQPPCTEGQAAVQFLSWLRQQMTQLGRGAQRILMVADGSYDTLEVWQHLPTGVSVLARRAKNRVLYPLAPPRADADDRASTANGR